MRDLKSPVDPVARWVYRHPRFFPLASDLLAWIVGVVLGALLKLTFAIQTAFIEVAVIGLGAALLHGLIGYGSGLYRGRWRVTSYNEVVSVTFAWCTTSIVIVVGNYLLRFSISDLPTSGLLTGSMGAALIMGSTRGVWRNMWERKRRPAVENCRRTIVFGAGEGGALMVTAMLRDPESGYYPVALLDDDPNKSNRTIERVRVEGTFADLGRVASRRSAEVLLLAIANAPAPLVAGLASAARKAGLEFRVLPSSSDLIGRMTLADVRPPTVDDLLGRDPVSIDTEAVSDYIRGKRVLITGAGGSIGSELSRQVFEFEPEKLFLVDRDETGLHGVQLALEGHALLDSEMLIVADIRDRDRMFEVFEQCRPDVVFHAAALKHLTLIENHPHEGVKTNTVGTANVLDAAVKVGVRRFVNVSTDKAADPSCVMGATKLAAERLTAMMAERTGETFVSVRFGNVLGSRGSVLPTFYEQLRQGKPLTVTHPEATRFFMTIPEASRLVVQAGAIGRPGEVMILDMGKPVKILDLAEQLVETLRPGTEIRFTGLRKGEKLHEILVAGDEIGVSRSHPRITHTTSDGGDVASVLDVFASPDHRRIAEWLLSHTSVASTSPSNLAPNPVSGPPSNPSSGSASDAPPAESSDLLLRSLFGSTA